MPYEEYKKQLESALTEIVSELTSIASHNEETGDWEAVPDAETLGNADDNIEADAIEDWNSRRAIVTELETRYRNINRALEKIAADTYGICEISGAPIEPERLAANPAARTNIANRDRERELPL
jgi:RNA polymerase-binding transcription factor DksA